MITRTGLFILALSVLAIPARAGVGADEALVLAKSHMYARFPQLDDPRVKILSAAASASLMKLVFSDPFALNGEVFWNVNTQYIWYSDPRVEYHYVGGEPGPQAASQAHEGPVDPAIKPEVVKYLSYMAREHGPLNPALRVAARPVTVYLFTFHAESPDVFKICGIDDEGHVFHPNAFSTLVPKPWR